MASYISNIPMKNLDPKVIENEALKNENRFLKDQVKKLASNLEELMTMLENNVCMNCKNKPVSKDITK